jgi:hypothetical protein
VRRFTDNDSLGEKLLHLRDFLGGDLKMSGEEGIQPLNLALKRNTLGAYQIKRRQRFQLVPFSGFIVEPLYVNGNTHEAICRPIRLPAMSSPRVLKARLCNKVPRPRTS